MPEQLPVFLVVAVPAALLAAGIVAIPLLRQGGAAIMAFVLALGVPAGALFLYLLGSNYSWTPAPQVATQRTEDAGQRANIPDMASALAQLEARLQEQPDDRDGWFLLGNTYIQMQRPADAERAFARALELSNGDDPDAKLSLAEAMALQDRSVLEGDAGVMIEEVLEMQPDNAKALWYGGLVALARGDRALVQARWEKLLEQDIPDPVRQMVTQQMGNLGFTAASTAPTTQVDAGTAIDVRVSISETLQAKMSPGAMLFLVARDADAAAGPPVAAVREQAAGLPRTLRISDANAMLAGRNLSQLQKVRLIARVSNGGGAIAQPGDVFGEATWSQGEGPVAIVMDQVVQP